MKSIGENRLVLLEQTPANLYILLCIFPPVQHIIMRYITIDFELQFYIKNVRIY